MLGEKTSYQFRKTDYQLFDTYFKRNLRIIGEYVHLDKVVGRLYEDKKIYKSKMGLSVSAVMLNMPTTLFCWVMTKKQAHREFIRIYEGYK